MYLKKCQICETRRPLKKVTKRKGRRQSSIKNEENNTNESDNESDESEDNEAEGEDEDEDKDQEHFEQNEQPLLNDGKANDGKKRKRSDEMTSKKVRIKAEEEEKSMILDRIFDFSYFLLFMRYLICSLFYLLVEKTWICGFCNKEFANYPVKYHIVSDKGSDSLD